MDGRQKICHFTSVHDPYDDRIYLKECISLSEAGYTIYIVAKGRDMREKKIQLVGCGMPHNRFERIFLYSRKIYKEAKRLNCDIYHFHDPELLPYGLKLKRQGKKVIFDSHEDIPSQILDKQWIPRPIRRLLSWIYKRYESYVVKRIDGVVAATNHIADCFRDRTHKIVVINNYPKLDDIKFGSTPFSKREPIVCYAGGISEIRGEKLMIEAMNGVEADLVLAGDHDVLTFSNGNGEVRYIGQLERSSVNDLYRRAKIGLCLLYPTANYVRSLPIKLFEYMAAGLPFVASDFSLWRSIAEDEQCGFCVDYEKPFAVKEAIQYILNHDEEAQEMGKRGRRAIEEKYNWSHEEKKLLSFYKNL